MCSVYNEFRRGGERRGAAKDEKGIARRGVGGGRGGNGRGDFALSLSVFSGRDGGRYDGVDALPSPPPYRYTPPPLASHFQTSFHYYRASKTNYTKKRIGKER
ncbi:hypothetical protein CDAR_195101 [Caerostris darwini]|uniref:Uncharacterized protein n=1 Tax=Caerostris darwini TaxID=1538125 RepID=A0AAV4X7C3_9ARAC|nr:hypothetical protein CDAR_195101 [Caerostris darwini]